MLIPIVPWREVLSFGPVIPDISERFVRNLISFVMRAYIQTNINPAQLCHVYRRWNDIGMLYFSLVTDCCRHFFQTLDLARNIYHNVTIEKIKFLNLLFDHEKKSERQLQGLFQQSEVPFSIPIFGGN